MLLYHVFALLFLHDGHDQSGDYTPLEVQDVGLFTLRVECHTGLTFHYKLQYIPGHKEKNDCIF